MKVDWPLRLKSVLARSEIGVLAALAFLIVIFGLARASFLTFPTWAIILQNTAELGVVTIGVTLLMIAGEFDLSVGANFGLTGIVLAMMMVDGMNYILAFILALLLATGIGFVNGLLTLKTRIPSFIVTLGSLFAIRGVALLVSGGRPNSFLGESTLLNILGGLRFRSLSNFSIETLWWVLLVLVAWVVLEKTRWGNWIFATGGNRDAARALGVPVNRVKLAMFALTGLLAGLAGSMQFGRFHSMSPLGGTSFELLAIAAAVIGGTDLFGGVGTILGAALGTIVMLTIKLGLPAIGINSYWYRILIGIMIVVAVVVNQKLKEAALKQ